MSPALTRFVSRRFAPRRRPGAGCGLGLLLLATACASQAPGGDGCPSGELAVESECRRLCNSDDGCGAGSYCPEGYCLPGIRPEITGMSPQAGEDGVDLAVPVVINFSVPMDPLLTAGALSVRNSQGAVAGTASWGNGDLLLTFVPAQPWSPGATYAVGIAQTATSAAGIGLAAAFDSQFTTSSALPVGVLFTSPLDGATGVGVRPTVAVTFSVPMEFASTASSFSLVPAGGGPLVQGGPSMDVGRTTLYFRVDEPLGFGATYVLRVAAGAQSLGGARTDTPFEASFSTIGQPDGDLPALTMPVIAGVLGGGDVDGLGGLHFTLGATDDGSGIEAVDCQVVIGNGAPGDAWVAAEAAGGDQYDCVWATGAAATPPDGLFTLHARALDRSGNVTSGAASFGVDLAPPALPTFLSPPPATWRFATLPLDVVGEAEASIEVFVNGAAAPDSPFALGAAGVGTVSASLPQRSDPSVVALFISDLHGNRNPSPVGVVVRRVAYECIELIDFGGGVLELSGLPVTPDLVTDDEEGLVTLTLDASDSLEEHRGIRSNNISSSGDSLPVGTSGDERRLLWQVDATMLTVPACAELVGARVRFTTAAATGGVLHAYALEKNWIESEARWNSATNLTDWETPGAAGLTDRTPELGAPATIPPTDVTPFEIDVRVAVELWRNDLAGATPALANNGLLFSADGYTSVWLSGGGTQAARRPRLILEIAEPR